MEQFKGRKTNENNFIDNSSRFHIPTIQIDNMPAPAYDSDDDTVAASTALLVDDDIERSQHLGSRPASHILPVGIRNFFSSLSSSHLNLPPRIAHALGPEATATAQRTWLAVRRIVVILLAVAFGLAGLCLFMVLFVSFGVLLGKIAEAVVGFLGGNGPPRGPAPRGLCDVAEEECRSLLRLSGWRPRSGATTGGRR
jgi:hypothetical protein